MHKPNRKEPVLPVSQNVYVVLALPRPPENWSISDWYMEKICGVPFLARNLFNLQRAELDSLIVYSNEDSTELHKRLHEEKKISIKWDWTTDVMEVVKSTKNYYFFL